MAKKSKALMTETDIDMTPMIDCVFQLVIFLMIVTDMTQKDLEDLVLPEATHCEPDKENPEENRPIVNVTQAGKVIISRDTFYDPIGDANRDRLKNKLRSIARRMPKKLDENLKKELPDDHLLIRGDEFTPWFHLAKVMEVCGDQSILIWKVELAVAESPAAKAKREKEQGP